MSIFKHIKKSMEKSKAKQESIRIVEEAKEKQVLIEDDEELIEVAKQLSEKLSVRFEDALIYLKAEKEKEEQKEKVRERGEHFVETGRNVLKKLEKWGEGVESPYAVKQSVKETQGEKSKADQERLKKMLDSAFGFKGGNKNV